MLTSFFDYCNKFYPLSTAGAKALEESIVIKELNEEEFLLKSGQVSNYACFVIDGLVRSYYVKNDKEITTKFLLKGSFITSIFSFYGRTPGTEFIKTVLPTKLACLHYNSLQKLYNEHLEINVLGRLLTEHYLYSLEVELYNLRKHSAEEKYKFFIKHYPHILQTCPLKYIASYLGVTIETLSRIRAKKSFL